MMSALLIGICLLLAAVLIPVASRLPSWIEFELVLGAWWIVWAGTLAWMLFHGHEVVDDHDRPSRKRSFSDAIGDIGALEGVADAGCAAGSAGCEWLGFLLVIIPLLVIGWIFLVELLIPGVAFLLYLAIRGMLARVTNSHRGCRDHTGLALMWGAFWATAYTAPIALLVWAVQVWVTRRG